jgi:murein tripeptide amidase MpaA
MINPDGVILGNSRTGLLGRDLNREYANANKELNKEIDHIKNLVNKIKQSHEIYMFLDFHGHSQKKNAFTYGP